MTSSFFQHRMPCCWRWGHSWPQRGYRTVGKGFPQVLRVLQTLPVNIWMSHSRLGDLILGMRKLSEVPFGSQSTVLTLEENETCSLEKTGPVLVLAWLLGNGMNLPSLAGFCTFILMIGQVLLLSLLKTSKILEWQFSWSTYSGI